MEILFYYGKCDFKLENRVYHKDTILIKVKNQIVDSIIINENSIEPFIYKCTKNEDLTFVFNGIERALADYQLNTNKLSLIELLYCGDEIHLLNDHFTSAINAQDTLQIKYLSNGCFHYIEQSISLYKEGNNYIATLKDEKETLKYQINKESIVYIRKIITELEIINNNFGCTTIDEYNIKINGQSTKYSDGSCEWKGFMRLKMRLKDNIKIS